MVFDKELCVLVYMRDFNVLLKFNSKSKMVNPRSAEKKGLKGSLNGFLDADLTELEFESDKFAVIFGFRDGARFEGRLELV
jgi:hypothetical protein